MSANRELCKFSLMRTHLGLIYDTTIWVKAPIPRDIGNSSQNFRLWWMLYVPLPLIHADETDGASWCSGSALDVHSPSYGCEAWPGGRLVWLQFLIFMLSPSLNLDSFLSLIIASQSTIWQWRHGETNEEKHAECEFFLGIQRIWKNPGTPWEKCAKAFTYLVSVNVIVCRNTFW
jgi:hypothetical protein